MHAILAFTSRRTVKRSKPDLAPEWILRKSDVKYETSYLLGTFNPSIKETEAGVSLSVKPA